MSMLEIRDLEVNYGMIAAIKGVSFYVNEGEVIALIGANGAGKTTILHTITGLLKAKAGSIMFEGHELTKTPAHKIVELGMAHVPEGRRIFSHLTVLENLKLGAYTRKDKGGVAADQMCIRDRSTPIGRNLSDRTTIFSTGFCGGLRSPVEKREFLCYNTVM